MLVVIVGGSFIFVSATMTVRVFGIATLGGFPVVSLTLYVIV